MKAILISIKPKYVADILNGRKTIEIRKTMPKCDLPIDVYIYCTKEKPYLANATEIFTGKYACISDDEISYGEHNLNGKVVAKFTLNKVEEISYNYRSDFTSVYTDTLDTKDLEKQACLEKHEFAKYLKGEIGYAWHISNLVIFIEPKELSEFYGTKQCFVGCENGIDKTPRYARLTKAPQSFMFIESEK